MNVSLTPMDDAGEQKLLRAPWQPGRSVPRLGDVMLAAAGAVRSELPELRLAPPGGLRSNMTATSEFDVSPEQQLAVINPTIEQAKSRLLVPDAARAVVVLIDGLGWHNLHHRAESAPFLTGGAFHAIPGTSTLPSTTAANITYLGTGVEPGQTAMLGYTVRNPGTGERMNLISWAGGTDPLEWQRVPTIFERFHAGGGTSATVSTWRFERSALTQAALRGSNYVAAESLAERVDATIELMHHTDTQLGYLYWADVDTAGHLSGWKTPHWAHEVQTVDTELERLARSLPSDTLVIVTADHGMIDVGEHSQLFGGPARLDIAAHPDLGAGLDLVAGENRFLHLYTAEPRTVAERWSTFLGNRAWVRTKDDALADGWFGQVRSDVAPVIGDVMVAVLGDLSIADSRVVSPRAFNMPGLHGSVTEWERCIPILTLLT